jgi:DNA-binding PadR family transcriptional regulator
MFMADQELYRGLIRLHILHHASEEPIFGLGMIRELRRHGYTIGPGTLYPLLHRLQVKKYLTSKTQWVGGKWRRCYTITAVGRRALHHASEKVRELFDELNEQSSGGKARTPGE